jgi:hypothetical protein
MSLLRPSARFSARSRFGALVVVVSAFTLAACAGDSPTAAVPFEHPATITPAQLQLLAGDAQVANAGMTVPVAPSVRLVDETGAAVANVTVTFTPGVGSGTVTGGVVQTDAMGVATVGAWVLGTVAGPQTLVASSSVLPGKSVTFHATVQVPQYDITVRFIGDGGTDRQRQAFASAVARWQRVIVGDIGTTPLNVPAGECQPWIPAVNESINDLLVFVRIANIDGAGKIVGQASPCYVNSGNHLPIMGFFELDQEDLQLMLDRGIMDDVVLHELGHILGIGTLWNYQRTLLTGATTDDPFFTGANARDAFTSIVGNTYAGTPVPVENSGGTGTRDAHWRKSVFNNELMQGYAQPGGMPLSRVTAASLADLGYAVNMGGTDSYSFLAALRTSPAAAAAAIPFGDDVAKAPLYEVQRNGGRRLVRPEQE